MLTEDILKGYQHTRRNYVEDFMTKHSGFHVGEGLWFAKEPWGIPCSALIMKVIYLPETSAYPQSSSNERGEIQFAFTIDFNSLSSAIACLTGNTANYHPILKMLMPTLSDEYVAALPTKP